MHRFLTTAGLALAALVMGNAAAHAQIYTVYSPAPVVVAPAPVVTTSYYCPPTTVLYQPAVSYYTPAVSYYTPAVSHYTPAVSYYTPVTSYYAPTTVYSSPVVATPGTVTTRSFVGLGIFRPRGVYTQTYYTPGVPVTSNYYSSVYFR